MSKHTIYIHARISPYEWQNGETEVTVYSFDMKGQSGWALLETREIDVPELTHDELVPHAVKAFQAEKDAIRADAEVKAQAIQSKIDKLLAIEVAA